MTMLLFIPIILFVILLSLCCNEKVSAYKGGWTLGRVYQKVLKAPNMTISHVSEIDENTLTRTERVLFIKMSNDKKIVILFVVRTEITRGFPPVTFHVVDVGLNGVAERGKIYDRCGEKQITLDLNQQEAQGVLDREIDFWDAFLNYSI